MRISSHTFKTNPKVTLPVIHLKGKKKGKIGFISGGAHGDELNGMMLVKNFLDYFQKHKLESVMKGELIVIPILNSSGFYKGKRRTSPDNCDFNRSFPGKRNGTLAQQLAKEIFTKFISKADFGIDCHDAGKTNILLPHTRVTLETMQLGRLFGSEIIVQREGKPGMMALETYKKFGTPLVTIELGGAQHIASKYLEEGVDGINNILKYYKIIPGNPSEPKHQYVLKNRFGVKTKRPGIIEFNAKLGAKVHAGDIIGSIYHPQSYEMTQLVTPMCGKIFALHDKQFVKKDEIIYSVLEFKKCHVDRTTTDKFKELPNFDIEQIVM